MNKQEATILTVKELEQRRIELPQSWKKAAGLLRHKRKALEKHVKAVRLEWDHKTR